MTTWSYDISRHSIDEVRALMQQYGYSREREESDILYCDAGGNCFFDQAADPYAAAIKEILNARGEEGWELVQITFREKEFICFWRKPNG